MYFVYILFSKKDKKLYTGLTTSLNQRVREHKLGRVKSTRNRQPLNLIYYEAYGNKLDAKRREKYLKRGNGRSSLKIQLENQLIKLNYKYL